MTYRGTTQSAPALRAPKSLPIGLWALLAASLTTVISAFLPWVTTPGTMNGFDPFIGHNLNLPGGLGPGLFTTVVAVPVAVLVGVTVALPGRRGLVIVTGAVALLSGVVTLAAAVHTLDTLSGERIFDDIAVVMGIGTVTTLFAGLVTAVAGVVLLIAARKVRPGMSYVLTGAEGALAATGPARIRSTSTRWPFWLVLAAGVVVMVAAALPWAEGGGHTVTGLSGGGRSDGLITAVAALSAIVLAALATFSPSAKVTSTRAGIYVSLAGVAAATLSGLDLADIGDLSGRYGAYGEVRAGVGLWLTLFGGLVLIAAGATVAVVNRGVGAVPGPPVPPGYAVPGQPTTTPSAVPGQVNGLVPPGGTGRSAEMSVKLEQLRQLGQLRDAGVITNEEFEAQKRTIL